MWAANLDSMATSQRSQIMRHVAECSAHVVYRPKPCWIASAFSWTALLARPMKIEIATINSKPITMRVRLRRRLGRLMYVTLEWSGFSSPSIRLPIAHQEYVAFGFTAAGGDCLICCRLKLVRL